MKVFPVAVCAMAMVTRVVGGEGDAGLRAAPAVVVVAAPAVDTAMVARASVLVSLQLARPALWRTDDRLTDWTNGPAAVAELRRAGEDLVVAVVDPVGGEEACTVVLSKEARAALVNVSPLRDPAGGEGDAGLYEERVGREVMRAFGMLAGLPPCPAPFCVMSPHRSLGDLDKKGRGFCPPCMLRAQGDMP